jgi:hypothetical protein
MGDRIPLDYESVYANVAKVVKGLWGYSRRLNEVKPVFCYLTGCDFKLLSSSTRTGQIIPFRHGLVTLLNKGMRVPTQEAARIIKKGYDHSSISFATASFERILDNIGITLPSPPIMPYAERLVSRVLANPEWENVKTKDLLKVYSREIGARQVDLRKGGRGDLLATQRAGFGYLTTEIRGLQQKRVIESFEFEFDRSTLSYGTRRIRNALQTYGEVTGVKVPVSPVSQVLAVADNVVQMVV